MYVKTRLEDLEQLKEEISVGGKEYRDYNIFQGIRQPVQWEQGRRLSTVKQTDGTPCGLHVIQGTVDYGHQVHHLCLMTIPEA